MSERDLLDKWEWIRSGNEFMKHVTNPEHKTESFIFVKEKRRYERTYCVTPKCGYSVLESLGVKQK